jgi:putative ABC transport system permease protein
MNWLRQIFSRRRRYDDLSVSIQEHLEEKVEDLMDEGMSREEAERAARREFGNVTRIEERSREVWQSPTLESIWADVRYASRQIRKSPGFAITVILTLALGIGANAAIFQVLDAVRLRELPVRAPNQLARVSIIDINGGRRGRFTWQNGDVTSNIWNELNTRQKAFSQIAAWSPTRFNLDRSGEVHYANGLMISGGFFDVLGTKPLLGRLITPADDYHGCGTQVAVISYSFWHRHFGANENVLGSKLFLSGHLLQIIGITPANFYGVEVGQTFDVAVPLCSEPAFAGQWSSTDNPLTWWLAVIGRLRPDWTLNQASVQLRSVSSGIFSSTTLPEILDPESKKLYRGFHLGASSCAYGISDLREQYDEPLWLLLALSGLVLLLACANIANLMLARASARQRETALRMSLGASRFGVARQFLMESLLLSVFGAIAGLMLAQGLSRILVTSFNTERSQIFVDLSLDWRVIAFTGFLTISTCILAGILPAIRTAYTKHSPTELMSGQRQGTRHGRFLMGRGLVTFQVALSLALLIVALLFVRTFQNLLLLNLGFQQDHVLITNIDISPLHIPVANRVTYKQELLKGIQNIPGVVSAASVGIVPLSGMGWNNFVSIPQTNGPRHLANFDPIGVGYFRTMETPLLVGRDFGQNDTPTSPRVAIVNQEFARTLFAKLNPIGKTFRVAAGGGQESRLYQIVGVVANTKYAGLREDPTPIVFLAETQDMDPGEGFTFVVRSNESFLTLVPAVKQAITTTSPEAILNFSVLKTTIREGLLLEGVMARLSSFFGILAAVLAMIGLYGLISFLIIRRRKEIGIRVALGARKRVVLILIMHEIMIPLTIGLALGASLALAIGVVTRSMLYGLGSNDPVTFITSILGIIGVAFLAGAQPARRAARVLPMEVLREE